MTVFAVFEMAGTQLQSKVTPATSNSDIVYVTGGGGSVFNDQEPLSGQNAGLPDVSPLPGNPATYLIADGSPTQSPLLIPFGTSAKKADKLIREAAAAAILAKLGWTIDPDDIYIPFASD